MASSIRAGPSALAAAQALQAYVVNLVRQGIASANPALPLRVVVEQVAARPYLKSPTPRPRKLLGSLLDVGRSVPVSPSSGYRTDYSRMEEDWPDAAAAPRMTTPKRLATGYVHIGPCEAPTPSPQRGDDTEQLRREEEASQKRMEQENAMAEITSFFMDEAARLAASSINPSELPPVPDEEEDNATKGSPGSQDEYISNSWR